MMMSFFRKQPADATAQGMIAAINKSQAVIEFTPEGNILHANANFLGAIGYTIDEIKGQHHSMFVEPAYRASEEYKQFWAKLARGEFDAAQYKRIAKGGREIWIQASYNPILDAQGKTIKVVKFATDITAQKMANANFEGMVSAVDKSQATIEFELDGTIITANENFLKTMGYVLAEVKGKHHSMCVEPEYAASNDYKLFWEKLRRGEYDAAQYKRVGKGGKEVWIQASYNPILDMNGRPFKVVKFASDITAQVKASQMLQLAVEQAQNVTMKAMAGDFSQRIPLEGKEGAIRNLADAMNSMSENIGTVMEDMVGMMSALADGDLTRRIDAEYQGTFGTLKDSANATAVKLSETVSEITASAKEVANAAAEISTSTTDLSQRTEEQAAGLEETSASMEEISATVKKNAENAGQANALTAGAAEVADKGGAVVAQAVEAMSRIEGSSSKIADIIGVIDEIARQTNLLALNAAVEAARAGDAGRGFAVVASEVRSLAQRSSQAAKDIKDLITNSSTQVKEGVDLVNRAGQSLNEIVQSIKNVANIVADIANASNEQATGIDQVNKALTQMDEVTQQNSALVEENAATAKTLESQAASMAEQVAFFRIEEDAHVAAMPTRTTAAKPAQPVRRLASALRTRGSAALKPAAEFEEF
jgi:methyl-accepting chemotaxis protein